MYEKVLGRTTVRDGIEFLCVDRGHFWSPRKGIVIRKFGEEKRVSVNFKKDTNIALVDGVTSDNLEESIQNGNAIRISPAEMIEICREIGYITDVTDDHIRKVLKFFVGQSESIDYEYGGEWGSKIKSILSDEEKVYFHEWEEMVGYEDREPLFKFRGKGKDYKIRVYNCENPDMESALYVVKHSERLMNAVLYLIRHHITDYTLDTVWNYLVGYNHREFFVDYMHFSDWNNNDPDDLMRKYDIKDEIIESKDHGFLSKNEVALREGHEFKMTTNITASFDDWDGFAVVVKKDCELNPVEINEVGQSIYYIEDDLSVKLGVVIGR